MSACSPERELRENVPTKLPCALTRRATKRSDYVAEFSTGYTSAATDGRCHCGPAYRGRLCNYQTLYLSENRQRLCALNRDPCTAEGERDTEETFHRLPAFEDGVMHVVIERPTIAVGHEARKTWIPKTPSRVPPKSEPDGWTMTEIQQ